MGAVEPMESGINYFGHLIGAGWQGATGVRPEAESRPEPALWTPAAIGAALGALSVRLLGKRKSAAEVALGGVIGTIVACAAAVAWTSRDMVAPAVRGAVRNMSAVRDARWLETNPINYA
jgi:hypothetical protein